MNLIILDVDGTLVHSLEAEALLFPLACAEALGIEGASSDWDSYRCPSDSGIVRELVETHLEREATVQDLAAVEQAFLSAIQLAYAAEPGLCRAVAGASEALHHFGRREDLGVAIATAGWHRTATHKMQVAGLSAQGLPIATSHDADAKVDIMRIVADRAAGHYGVGAFDSVVCFGDSAGDERAAGALGYGFVGIDTAGFVRGTRHRFPDFSRLEEIVRVLDELTGA